ncbi:MAG TPA: hypothetical protein DD417_16880 [Elusimicrobia bacterium]|nr:hypothetical protein [Elusimicrobiota bacterium]
MPKKLSFAALFAVLIVAGLIVKNAPAGEDKKAAPAVEEKKAADPKAAPAAEKKAEDAQAAPSLATEEELKDAPEFIKYEKAKLGPVKFPHHVHAKTFGCKACHADEKPLFPNKIDPAAAMKMADMYAGKGCGSCHDGKDHGDHKKVFSSKMCMKCHKKEKPAK